MALIGKKKKDIISKFRTHGKDTGSPEIQVALLTERINELTGHLKKHKKDLHSRQGLFKMVSNRRRLLGYLQKADSDKYNKLIKKLKIRK